MRVKMTSIAVNDPNVAFKFYTEVLGFQSFMHMPEAQLAIVVSAQDPQGTALMLEPNTHPLSKTFQAGLYAEGIPCMTLGVANVAQEYDRLLALGVRFSKAPTTNDYGTEAYFDDGQGNIVQLHQDD